MSHEPKTDRRELSRANFYRLCNELSASRKELLEERPTRPVLAATMESRLGYKVPETALREALETLGIEFTPKVNRAYGDRSTTAKQNTRVLAKSIRLIYKKLGEEVPADLEELYQRQMGLGENGKV